VANTNNGYGGINLFKTLQLLSTVYRELYKKSSYTDKYNQKKQAVCIKIKRTGGIR